MSLVLLERKKVMLKLWRLIMEKQKFVKQYPSPGEEGVKEEKKG